MFGKKHIAKEKCPQFVLCNDNLSACIEKTSQLLTYGPFLNLIQGVSGLTKEQCAAVFTENSTTKDRRTMSKAIMKKLPDVTFENI